MRRHRARRTRCQACPFPAVPVPPGTAFITASSRPSDSATASAAPAAQPQAQVSSSRYCIHHHWCPDLHRQQLSHTPSFPGSPSPRSPARFACLLSVEFVEQTTGPSRTVRLSGAFPDFPRANPLSRMVLIAVFSVHFQDCQALQALTDSCSPHALMGTDSLTLTA